MLSCAAAEWSVSWAHFSPELVEGEAPLRKNGSDAQATKETAKQ